MSNTNIAYEGSTMNDESVVDTSWLDHLVCEENPEDALIAAIDAERSGTVPEEFEDDDDGLYEYDEDALPAGCTFNNLSVGAGEGHADDGYPVIEGVSGTEDTDDEVLHPSLVDSSTSESHHFDVYERNLEAPDASEAITDEVWCAVTFGDELPCQMRFRTGRLVNLNSRQPRTENVRWHRDRIVDHLYTPVIEEAPSVFVTDELPEMVGYDIDWEREYQLEQEAEDALFAELSDLEVLYDFGER
jgi:hypothetical protein